MRRAVKRYAVLSLWLLMLPLCGVCSDGVKMLTELSSAMSSLGRYSVDFSVEVGGEKVSEAGAYMVDGERYILTIAGQKFYGDDTTRYTIDTRNREVVIEPIDGSVQMVIANPAQAFSQLEKGFDVEVIEGAACKLLLTPKVSGAIVESSELELDSDTKLPRSISYVADGESVKITILRLVSTSETIPKLTDIEYPEEFTVIDLR